MVAVRRAEEFYERVLVGYGDDSVAELAGAHVAVEQASTLAAKALEDSRIGISPLEKSTRYVRFDRRAEDGKYLYYRGSELTGPDYEPAAEALFETYSKLVEPATQAIRERFPQEEGETDRAWKAATRAKALDLLRGLLRLEVGFKHFALIVPCLRLQELSRLSAGLGNIGHDFLQPDEINSVDPVDQQR